MRIHAFVFVGERDHACAYCQLHTTLSTNALAHLPQDLAACAAGRAVKLPWYRRLFAARSYNCLAPSDVGVSTATVRQITNRYVRKH